VRIISDFHDYYDSILSYGQDKKLVYLRKTKIEKLKYTDLSETIWSWRLKFSAVDHSAYEFNNVIPEPDFGLIGFCGKWYGCLLYTLPESKNVIPIYSTDDMITFLHKQKVDKERIAAFREGRRKVSSVKYMSWRFTYNKLSSFFTALDGIESDIEYFFKYKAPILFFTFKDYTTYTLTINPNLKKLNFQKIVDPFTAFQELSMFISGRLGVEGPETITISNESMITKKGFDKWSFRKKSNKVIKI